MFNFTSSLRIYLCVQPTDMRKAFNGLYAIAKHQLELNPVDGSLFLFANRRRDRVKLLYWDGQGFCLYYKILERGRFPWPNTKAGAARLTSAQLAMLWEGIDWRRPDWGAPPARVG